MTEHGFPDFALMVDIMGIDTAILYEHESRSGEKVYRCLVTEMTDNHIDFMEGYDVARSGWKYAHFLKSDTAVDEDGFPWDSVLTEEYRTPSVGERGGVRHSWQMFLDGRLKIIGHIFDVQ